MWGEDWGTMIWSGIPVPMMGPLGWTFLLGALVGALVILYRKPLSKAKTAVALLVIALVPLIAIGQVTLPNTFTNGTVADADEVNANFDALLEESARFHQTLVGMAIPRVAIPVSVTDQLCRDDDGLAALHVAGRALADLHRMLPAGLQVELGVEGGDPVDAVQGHPGLPREPLQRLFG